MSNREGAKDPMGRKLVWTENSNFQGWACTDCSWVFNPSWPLAGESIEEMKTNFRQKRDKEFAFHVCAEHPRVAKNSS
jgi:rubredoxin